MSKSASKPQRWDIYLIQTASKENAEQLVRYITAFKGRKSQEVPPRFSFSPKTNLAGLAQVEVTSDEQLKEHLIEYAKVWMVDHIWDPALVEAVKVHDARVALSVEEPRPPHGAEEEQTA